MTKKIFIILFSLLSFALLLFYISFLSLAPVIVNSPKIQNKIINVIQEKTGYSIEFNNLALNTNYNLTYTISLDDIKLLNTNREIILKADAIKISFLKLKFTPYRIDADKIYFNKTKLENNNSQKENKFKINNIPEININSAKIILKDDKKTKFNLTVSNFKTIEANKNKLSTFDLIFETNFVKDKINALNSALSITNDKITIESLTLCTKNSELDIKGSYPYNSNYNLTIHGNKLSIEEIEHMFLYFIKQKEPDNKNFIENFDNFKGNAGIDLIIKPKDITGKITLENFKATYTKFNIPMYFKNATFNFNKDLITLKEKGTIGNKEGYTDFYAENVFSPDKTIKGNLQGLIDDKTLKNALNFSSTKKNLPIDISYYIKNKEITVDYKLQIPKNSNIVYKNTNIIPDEKEGKITVQTFKKGNVLYLKELNYMLGNDNPESILTGKGSFLRENNKYHLQDISIKTKERTPVLFLAFLEKYIKGGYFEGDINYNAPKKLITGIFQVFDAKYKNFYVKNATISADNDSMKIKAAGNFEMQPFTCFIDLVNGFDNNITVNDINLYLKKYVIKRTSGKKQISQKNKKNIQKKIDDFNFTVKKGKITLQELNFKNIVLENLALTGFIENSMAYFIMPDIKFAKGFLKAEGIYDFKYSSSAIDFEASAIDSNSAADMIFNLKNQIEGTSNATMSVKAYDGVRFIDANADFSVENGALTKIGSTEFIIKKSENKSIKLKLKDLINIDINKMQALKSNLYGGFNLKNEKVQDIELYSKHKYLSVYATGDYNINTQNSNINLLGRYNKKAQKGIRVLFVPLSWITKFIFRNSDEKNLYYEKIKKIPPVEANDSEQEIFSVKINGNLNNASKLNVDLRSLK